MSEDNNVPELFARVNMEDVSDDVYTDAILFLLAKKYPNYWNDKTRIDFRYYPLEIHSKWGHEDQSAVVENSEMKFKWLEIYCKLDFVDIKSVPNKLLERLISQDRLEKEDIAKAEAGEYAGELITKKIDVTEHDISGDEPIEIEKTFYLYGEDREDWDLGNNWMVKTKEIFKTSKEK